MQCATCTMEMQMEAWIQVSRGSQIPSSFTTQLRHSLVLTLANGSPFLYCIDLTGGKKLVGCVKNSVCVTYVGSLRLSDSAPSVRVCAVCCLDNGHITVASVEEILSKFSNKSPMKDKDIFKDLLSSTGSSQSHQRLSYTPGESVSITIARINNSSFTLLRASIHNNTLLVCQRSKLSGEQSLLVYHGSRKANCGGCEVPIFSGPPQATYSISTGITKAPPNNCLLYQPPLLLAACIDSVTTTCTCDTTLDVELFSKLFGSEVTLSGSPVTLLGSQNGHIFHSSASQIVSTESGASSKQLLPVMYSLGQPVHSIHALHLPENETQSLALNLQGAPSRAPNTLVLIGRQGKIVLCTAGVPTQRTPSFLEFHVPGPITSTLLVTDHTLLYSTPTALYSVCVEGECIKRRLEGTHCAQAVFVPEINFRLPQKAAIFNRVTFLLDCLGVWTSNDSKEFQLLCMSLEGVVSKRTVVIGVCGMERSRSSDEGQLAKELKECLQSIETTSARLDELSKRKEQHNNTLMELSKELTALCQLAHSSKDGTDNDHFRITYQATYENIGVLHHKPCVNICLTYTGAAPLSKGWSLLVQIHPVVKQSVSKLTMSSHQIPLTSLQPNKELCLKMPLDNFHILHHIAHCYVHYDPSHLLHHGATPTSVTIPLYEASFDIIDFLLPPQLQPRQLPWQPTNLNTTPLSEEDEFPHDNYINVDMDTIAKVISTEVDVNTICQQFLKAILVREDLAELVTESEPDTWTATLNSYDGSKVCLQAYLEEGTMILYVHTSSDTTLSETFESVTKRIKV